MKRYNIINFCFALTNPILGFLSSLYNILNLRDSCFLFAFSVSLICIYFPIMYDTSANFYSVYYLYSGEFLNWFQPYTFVPSYLIQNYGIDFYFFIFINVIFVVYTWTKIVLKIFRNSIINYKVIFIFIFLIFTFNYRDLMDINRNILAYSIIFYYFYLIDKKNILIFLVFSCFSILIHSSSLIILVLYFLSKIKFGMKLNLILLIFSLICGFFLPGLINNAVGFVENIPIYGGVISYYLYGDSFGVQEFTLGTALKKIINCFIILFVSLYVIKIIEKKGNNENLQFLLLVGFFALIFFNFVTFFERINLAFNFMLLSVFLYGVRFWYAAFIASLIFIRSLSMYVLVYFPIFFGDYSHVLVNDSNKNQMMLKPLYYPTLFLLNIHDNGYSDEFILKNSIWKGEK